MELLAYQRLAVKLLLDKIPILFNNHEVMFFFRDEYIYSYNENDFHAREAGLFLKSKNNLDRVYWMLWGKIENIFDKDFLDYFYGNVENREQMFIDDVTAALNNCALNLDKG